MKIGILIQARMGSSRLPGKILEKIGGEAMIIRILNELTYVSIVSVVQVVTSSSSKDDVLCDLLDKKGISYFRGDEHDVLHRFLSAAKTLDLDLIVRLNGDCPFIDPIIVQSVIDEFLCKRNKVDYISTVLDETFPIGVHIEVFSTSVLEICDRNAKGFEREHVTPYIYNNPEKFRLASFNSDVDLSEFRLTVDYPEDLLFARQLADLLDSDFVEQKPKNNLANIIKHLEANRDLVSINANFKKSQTIRY